jgi:hypothetical protein
VDHTGPTGAYDFTLTLTMTDRPPKSAAVVPETAAPGAPYLLDAYSATRPSRQPKNISAASSAFKTR